jgi:hypothetical protein
MLWVSDAVLENLTVGSNAVLKASDQALVDQEAKAFLHDEVSYGV